MLNHVEQYIASYSSILLKPVKMFDFEKKHEQFAISLYRYTEIPFCFRLNSIVHYSQYSDRRKASLSCHSNVIICPEGSSLETVVFIDLAIDNALG